MSFDVIKNLLYIIYLLKKVFISKRST